jgi:hypothetical protein
MFRTLLLLALIPLSGCLASTAVRVTGAVAGAAIRTTGAVAGAAVHAVTPHHHPHDQKPSGEQHTQ